MPRQHSSALRRKPKAPSHVDASASASASADRECPTPTSSKTWLAQMGPWARAYYKHQIDVPAVLILATLVVRFCSPFETLSSFASSLLMPSHAVLVDSSECGAAGAPCVRYAKGPLDVAFVCFYFCVMALLRAVCLDYCLKPLAHSLRCPRAKIARFCEQGWLTLYYSFTFAAGMYLIVNSPIWENLDNLWIGYPHWHHSARFKFFYLAQLSFWIQQLAIVHVEKPRKDKNAFVAHHIITCLMIIGSYATNYVRLGVCVFASFDVADILLSAAKCLVYLNLDRVANVVFALFVVVWIYSRHYVYTYLVYLFAYRAPKFIQLGRVDAAAGYFAARPMFTLYLGAFIALQLMVTYWSVLIVMMIVRVLRSIPGDPRSDDEDEDGGNAGKGNSQCDDFADDYEPLTTPLD